MKHLVSWNIDWMDWMEPHEQLSFVVVVNVEIRAFHVHCHFAIFPLSGRSF